MTGKGRNYLLWHMAQFGTLRPLFVLPLHGSMSPSIRRWRCLGPLKPIMVLLTFRAPQHSWNPKQFFFPSLQGGERAPKVPHFLALGQVWMEAKPQSKFELSSSAQGWSHHVPLEILTIWKGPQLEGGWRLWPKHSGDTLCPFPAPGTYRGTELPLRTPGLGQQWSQKRMLAVS